MLRRKMEYVKRFGHRLPPDEIDHQPHLAGRGAYVSVNRLCFHCFLSGGAYDAGVVVSSFLIPGWTRNVRVGENSPSLCPTIPSWIYTGMNLFPLCTAKVCPTKSG